MRRMMNILRNCVVGSCCLRDAKDHNNISRIGKCHLESSVKSRRVLYLDLEFLKKFLFILILDPKFEQYVMIFSLLWLVFELLGQSFPSRFKVFFNEAPLGNLVGRPS